MKLFFRRIHLYLSLAAGLVILTCCLTGAILVFEKDLQQAFNPERYFVEATGKPKGVEELLETARAAYPGAKINSVKTYADPLRTVEVSLSASGGKEAAKGGKPERQPGFTLFMHPYTGKVIERYSYRETAFFQIFALHRWLLGGEKSIGKYIVGISTFIFLFILITGIALWWPKTRAVLKQRLRVRWNGSSRRLAHDLHVVFGFYSAIFLFIFAFTGLAWSFEWFNKGIYTVTRSPQKPPAPPKSVYYAAAQKARPDEVLNRVKAAYPGARFYALSLAKDSTEAHTVTLLPASAIHESATTAVYLDQWSGAILGRLSFEERSLGARVRSSFKPVHTGSIWGLPSKVVAFLVCLLGVTFPITGTIMWYNRTRKKKRSARPAPRQKKMEEATTA
jgi:uncharacterized iron-regulated membrane protein